MNIVPADEMRRLALRRELPAPITTHPFLMIAEVKLASPSEGVLRAITSGSPEPSKPMQSNGEPLPANTSFIEVIKQAKLYEANDAGLISVLAEPLRFGGDLSHVAKAAASVRTPVMRKDFLVSPYQIYESRAVGARAVLLIVRMLDDRVLQQMIAAASECNLLVILEVFNDADIARTQQFIVGHSEQQNVGLGIHPHLCIGVNTRDLSTLKVSPLRLEELSPHITPDVPWIAESGLQTPEDVARAVALGYSGALIGSALMKSSDPGSLCRQLAFAGQTAAVTRLVARKQAERARLDKPGVSP